jgi:hypothetical protein
MGNAKYYLTLAVAALAIGIYNFATQSDASGLQCFSIQKKTQAEYEEYLKSLANSTVPVLAANKTIEAGENSVWEVPVSGTTTMASVQMILAFIYLGLCGLSFILCLVVYSLEDQVPDDFLKMGKCKRFIAVLCKLFPMLFVIIHWVCCVIIVVLWILLFSGDCQISRSTIPGDIRNKDKYYNDSFVLNIVTSCLWILIQYGGAIIREVVYKEPFMYSQSNTFFRLGP